MSLISLTQTSSGSSFKIDESDLIKFYNRGTQTVVEYIAKENGLRKRMDVNESTTAIEAEGTKIITTSMNNQYLFLNSEKILSIREENSLAVVTYDNAGSTPETLNLDVTEAVFLASIPSEAPSGYKVYTALITQTGTSAPTAIVLENTLGGDIVWTYDAQGSYSGTLSGAFTTDKTAFFNNNSKIVDDRASQIIWSNENVLFLGSGRPNSGATANDVLTNETIEIRVYD